MARYEIEYYSQALRRHTSFRMVIPNDPREGAEPLKGRRKTLFLLHGYTGNAGNWVPEELCQRYNFAIVIPTGENGFWLDGLSTGHAFCTMVGEELVAYVRETFGLALRPEDTAVMGMSMGGFGAMHTGLYYPQVFGKIGALSSALIMEEIAVMKPGESNKVANYDYYRECFGELDRLLQSTNNPGTLALRLKEEGRTIPGIYMCCGTEDFLLETNRRFHRLLEENGIAHIYKESPGQHDMVFWNEYVPKIIEWMFG